MVKKARIVKSPYFAPPAKDHKLLCAGSLCLLGYTGAKNGPKALVATPTERRPQAWRTL